MSLSVSAQFSMKSGKNIPHVDKICLLADSSLPLVYFAGLHNREAS